MSRIRQGGVNMRRVLVVITCLVLGAVIMSPRVQGQGGKVVIYSALDAPVTNEILKAFERTSGLQTEALTLAAAGTLATRIRAEKVRPQADVFLGGSIDFHAPLAKEGLLDAYKSPRLAEATSPRSSMIPTVTGPGGTLAHWPSCITATDSSARWLPKGSSLRPRGTTFSTPRLRARSSCPARSRPVGVSSLPPPRSSALPMRIGPSSG